MSLVDRGSHQAIMERTPRLKPCVTHFEAELSFEFTPPAPKSRIHLNAHCVLAEWPFPLTIPVIRTVGTPFRQLSSAESVWQLPAIATERLRKPHLSHRGPWILVITTRHTVACFWWESPCSGSRHPLAAVQEGLLTCIHTWNTCIEP